jgi:hypothetical protein
MKIVWTGALRMRRTWRTFDDLPSGGFLEEFALCKYCIFSISFANGDFYHGYGRRCVITIRCTYAVSSQVSRLRSAESLRAAGHVVTTHVTTKLQSCQQVTMQLLWLLLTLVPSVTPRSFNGSSLSDLPVWGTYRPNLYFGLRPRLPQSLMTGLIWFGTQDYQSITSKSFPKNAFKLPL